MGDKSPKSTSKNAAQKKAKNDGTTAKKASDSAKQAEKNKK